ncbi:hypothetical protein F4821DRAFT_262204 [Hypoxylon rubiginosum]|uniref:Uncharacterized protein n=1 Tax=Hypoxylon rubiginosum TaxID=110542 RepID=A0ACC0CUR4_9PEZI|nr:hypothetical protein F4821DRAFT_262204 [Hypoxylon rubiginosum]
MVKIVNSQTAKLAEAQKTIAEYKKKNAALQLQVSLLQKKSRPSSAQRTSVGSSTSSGDSYKSPHSEKSVCSAKTYDRPTRASATRAAETLKKTRPVEKAKRGEAHFGDETYVYVNERPMPTSVKYLPGFMQKTESSRAKEIYRAYQARLVVRKGNDSDDSDGRDWFPTTPRRDTTPSDTTASKDDAITPPAPSLRTCQELNLLVGESIKYLFPRGIVRICSDTGHKMLVNAHRIAQEAFHDACHRFWPRLWDQVQEGPHVVSLGRQEIASYVGDFGDRVDLSLCGSDHSTVYCSLQGLVPLRNRICHPETGTFQNVIAVDGHLRDVRYFLLALGDEERGKRVKSMLDDLRRLATESFEQISLFQHLAILPESQMDVPWELHHVKMFKALLYNDVECDWRGWDDEDKEKYVGLLDVARAWALENSPSLLHPVDIGW